MPATRASKRKAPARKGKATAPADVAQDEPAVEQPQAAPPAQEEDPDQMNVDSVEVPPPPKPAASSSRKGKKAATSKVKKVVETVVAEAETVVEKAVEKAGEVAAAAGEFVEEMTGVESTSTSKEACSLESKGGAPDPSGVAEPTDEGKEEKEKEEDGASSKPKLTMEERRAKMEELRKKMAAGTKANRQSLAEESARAKLNARELARLERQRKLAETLRLKADAEERGEDAERQKNWEYTIEENDEWEKKLAKKKRRADYEFHDDAHAARRRYKKDLDQIKPDLETYNAQKAVAMGLNPSGSGALTAFSATNTASTSAIRAVTSEEQRLASENLYRDANTLIYGDNKPSDEAIDRVVGKINKDIEKQHKFHRKRVNEEEGDITYINEHNRVFNKKIARYYDKYTAEIRASFERGTAL